MQLRGQGGLPSLQEACYCHPSCKEGAHPCSTAHSRTSAAVRNETRISQTHSCCTPAAPKCPDAKVSSGMLVCLAAHPAPAHTLTLYDRCVQHSLVSSCSMQHPKHTCHIAAGAVSCLGKLTKASLKQCAGLLCCRSNVVTEDLDKIFSQKASPQGKKS